MDISVKLCCSLKWLSGVITKKTLQQAQTICSLLLEPYENGVLKSNVIESLTKPNLYVSAYSVLFPDEQVKDGSFEPLIHALGKKGGYVLEDDDVIVTGSMLAQENPFREKSHLALLDVLMIQYASKVVTTQRIVKAVRQISTFNSSKELPNKCKVDHLLTLWLNKVTESVRVKRLEEVEAIVHDPDPRQRRKNKALVMKSGGTPVIPHIISGELYSGVNDGQCLAALLLHYVPHACIWNDFMIADHSLSQKHSLINLQVAYDYCNTHLSPPGFHLSPNDWVEWGQSGVLGSNILALLAHLFSSFELKQLHPITKKPSSLISQSTSSSLSFPRSLQSKSTILSDRSLHAMKPPPHAINYLLQSQSSGLLSSSEVSNSNKRHLIHTSQMKTSMNDTRLSHMKDPSSANCLLSSSSNSMTFKAPLRSSLNTSQTSALAAFNVKKKHPLIKGTHSQSSPLINPHVLPSVPPSMSADVSAYREPISISTRNLNIHQEMINDRKRNRVSVVRQWRDSQEVLSHGSDQKNVASDLANRSGHDDTREERDSQSSQFEEKSKDEIDNGNTLDVLPREFQSKLQSSQRSFTLDRQHTLASASAAGLPIINDTREPCEHMEEKPCVENVTISVSSSHQTLMKSSGVPQKSARSDSSGVIMLTNLLQMHRHGRWVCGMPTQKMPIPSSAMELKVNLMPLLASLQSQNAHMESEAMLHRLKLLPEVERCSSEVSKVILSDGGSVAPHPREEAAIGGGTIMTKEEEKEDLISSGSLPDIHKQRSLIELNETTLSLEQYEHADKMHQHVLESSPSDDAPKCDYTEMSTIKKISKSYQPLQDFPFSPITGNGQVFIEQTPLAIARSDFDKKSVDSDDRVWPHQEILPSQHADAKGHCDTWVSPLHQDTEMEEEEEDTPFKKKKQQIKSRLEERDCARRLAAEKRRKNKKIEDISIDHMMDHKQDTIHFKLSAFDKQGPKPESVQVKSPEQYSAHVYSGPVCYVKPKTKSNLKIIRNAICAVCLAGEVNLLLKQKTLCELEKTSANHVVILFRDSIGFKFRSIYSYNQGDKHVVKIYGTGPKDIKEIMISNLYKYNCGQKEFKEIPTRSLSVSLDALTIKSEYWYGAKRRCTRTRL